jgi:hypothetical protein
MVGASLRRRFEEMMCGLVVRRLKPGSYEEFRRAWEPLSEDEWPRGMTRLWIGRADDDPDVVATWGVFELDQQGLDELRDDPHWMAAESRRMERMGRYEEELVISTFLELVEEVVPPAARTS